MPPEIPDGLNEKPPKKFTDEEIMDELKDILYWARDKVNFRFKHWTDLVEVYIGESLNYIINRNLYHKLMDDGDNDGMPEMLKDNQETR